MPRLALLFAAMSVAVFCNLPVASSAGTATPTGHKVPMHPQTLTLKTGARVSHHRRQHHYAHDTFRQTSPIHGTMAGPRI